MKEITMKVYHFDELSTEAQEFVLDERQRTHDYSWEYENRKTLEAFEKLFDISVDFVYGYEYNLDFIVKTNHDYDEDEFTGVRLYKYLQNNFVEYLREPKVRTNSNDTKKYYSKVFSQYKDCPLTGYYIDEDILDPIHDFLRYPDSKVTFVYLMEKCISNYLKVAQDDYESYYSKEYVSDDCNDRGSLFFEDGSVYDMDPMD